MILRLSILICCVSLLVFLAIKGMFSVDTPRMLKGRVRHGFMPLSRIHGLMPWICFGWHYPCGWAGPYVKIYRCGYRIFGFEWEYFATWDLDKTGSDKEIGIEGLHLIAPVEDYGKD